MKAGVVAAIVALLTGLLAGSAQAGADPARADAVGPPAPGAPGGAALLLSIRARALGLTQEAVPDDGLEPMRAPTGEGTTRMPSAATTELARGVYLTVSPVCLPGVDEPLFPSPARPRVSPPPRRR
jgi:hypothetical protein